MAIPKNKEELQNAIEETYKKLTFELDDIPANLAQKKDLEGHAKNSLMSINNLLAYLVGWGQLVLKWNTMKSKGLAVDFPETGYKWNELGRLAQKFYSDYERDDLNSLKLKLDVTTKEILQLIQNKTNKQLYQENWYDTWPLGRLIQLNTSSPFKNATARIRKWKKSTKTKKNS